LSDRTPHDEEHARRAEDRERLFTTRLDTLEHGYQELRVNVAQLESSVKLVGVEQGHLKELFNSRLMSIERGQEVQIGKLDTIDKNLTTMVSDPEKSPVSRALTDQCMDLKKRVDDHAQWRSQVEGVLVFLKWIGAAGLIALGLQLLRIAKLIP
jgi:hypothetical protein